MIQDFIYYLREYGFRAAWLYLQIGSDVQDEVDLEDNFDIGCLIGLCDCKELV